MKKKTIWIILFVTIVVFLYVARVYQVNTVVYQQTGTTEFSTNEWFKHGNFNLSISPYEVVDTKDLLQRYPHEPVIAEEGPQRLFDLTIQLDSSIEEQFDLSVLVLQIGKVSGGGVNPNLFNLMNPDANFLVTLQPGEKITVKMPYPIDEHQLNATPDDIIKLIFSLYPKYIAVKF